MSGREICFDTETTGLDTFNDRLVEIGCVEIVNLVPTGKTYHTYINPQREVSPGAFKVHGISNEFLYDKPTFAKVADDFLDFIGDAPLVGHNAARFDVPVINEELKRLRRPPLQNEIIDSLLLARQVKKTGYHNLDALCRHFNIDNSKRKFHGALLDSEILAEVYLALRGGRQFSMDIPVIGKKEELAEDGTRYGKRTFISRISDQEIAAHRSFIEALGPTSIWARHLAEPAESAA